MSESDDASSCADIQSAMVEEVLENSLPVHVASLSQARKQNAAEIAKLQAELIVLKEKSSKGKQDIEQLTVEANTLISKICTFEEEGSKTAVHVAELEKDISRAIEERENLRWKLRLKEQDCCLSDRKYLIYKKKMEAYKSSVEETEKSGNAVSELESIKKELEVLKTKKTDMDILYQAMIQQVGGEGKTIDDIRKEHMLLEQVVDQERCILDHTKTKLINCQQNVLGMETANGIIKKKNSALLTRLKRQVEERKENQEQIASHIKCIVDKIEITKIKLDNIATEHINN